MSTDLKFCTNDFLELMYIIYIYIEKETIIIRICIVIRFVIKLRFVSIFYLKIIFFSIDENACE